MYQNGNLLFPHCLPKLSFCVIIQYRCVIVRPLRTISIKKENTQDRMTQALGILEFLLCIENSRILYYVIPQLDPRISLCIRILDLSKSSPSPLGDIYMEFWNSYKSKKPLGILDFI